MTTENEIRELERIQAAGKPFWAALGHQREGQIDQRPGAGRGFYFQDPDGHNLEVLTNSHSGRRNR
jgi:catechol 2,3-dioxygenase-like lactoylglutathione lyase family enzyme